MQDVQDSRATVAQTKMARSWVVVTAAPAAASPTTPAPTAHVAPPDSTVVKAIIWSENIVLGIAGIALALAPLYRLSGMLSRKAQVPDELLCLAGLLSLAVVVFNVFGGTLFALGIAGEPVHFVSQIIFAIVVGGAIKLHTLEDAFPKLGLDAILLVLGVLASAPTVGYGQAGGGVVVGALIGFLLGTFTMGNTKAPKAREIQPESDYYIRA